MPTCGKTCHAATVCTADSVKSLPTERLEYKATSGLVLTASTKPRWSSLKISLPGCRTACSSFPPSGGGGRDRKWVVGGRGEEFGLAWDKRNKF